MRLSMNRLGGAFAALAVVATGAVALDIEPSVVTQVASASDGVWVTAESTGEIVRIDGPTGEPTARVEVAAAGSQLDVLETDDQLVVVDQTAGDVLTVDRALHRVDRRTATGLAGLEHVDLTADGIAVAQGTAVAHVGADLEATTVHEAPAAATGLALAGDEIVVSHAVGVSRLDEGGASVVDDEAEQPGVAHVGDAVVWSDGELLRVIDGDDTTCLESAPGPGARWAGDRGGAVAVADPTAGAVQLAHLDEGWCRTVELTDPGSDLAMPAFALGAVFVVEPAAGAVHIVDVARDTEPVRASIGTSGPRTRVHVRGDVVVAHDPDSSRGAVLDADGVVRRVDSQAETPVERAQLSDSGPTAVVGDESDVPALEFEGSGGSSSPDENASGAVPADGEVGEAGAEPLDPTSDELVANFAFSTDVVVVGEVVQFVDESTGSPTSWVWDFGDGTGATGPAAEKSWDSVGTYTVTLFVERDGETAEVSLPISVVSAEAELPPNADFDVSATTVSAGATVQFEDRSTGEVDRRLWEFGGGVTSDEASPTMSWDTPGAYTVTLTVANDLGSDSASVVIDVVRDLQAPVADIVAAPSSGEVGQRLDFSGRSAGGPAALTWFLGDGRVAGGASISHVYTAPGTYTVRLVATNAAGTSEVTAVVDIRAATVAPVARIATLPQIIEVGDVVTLTALTVNDPDRQRWEFGDGATAEGAVVQHAWSAAGTYVVSLTASNAAGSDEARATVTVLAPLPPPVAAIGIVPEGLTANPVAGRYTNLVDQSLYATAWSWHVDGIPVADTQNHRHLFSTPGEHTVTLYISNRTGQADASLTVNVLPPLQAAFSPPATQPQAGTPATFVDQSTGATSWSWTVDGVPVGAEPDLVYTFAASGTYTVALTVGNANGTDRAEAIVVVDPQPPTVTAITINPAAPETGRPVTLTGVLGDPAAPVDVWSAAFGDGTPLATSASGSFVHTFAAAGVYTVEITASGPVAAASLTRTVTVTDPPVPAFTLAASPTSPEVGQSTTITATPTAGSGPIVGWSWTVDGVPAGGSSSVLTTSFGSAGPHVVAATAQGPVTSVSNSTTVTAVLPPPPDIVDITASPGTGTAGVNTTFTPVSVGGAVVSYSWTIDGAPAGTGSTLNRTFGAPGTYRVEVTAAGPFQSDVHAIDYLVIAPPSVSSPAPDNPSPVAGSTVTFTSSPLPGSGPVSTWTWQVNGATVPSAGSSMSYTFGAAGSFTVTVIATGPTGVSDTESSVINVAAPPPAANFSWGLAGATSVQFTDLSSGGPVTSWAWTFGDGTSSSQQSPLHPYAAPGTYSVTLTVSGPGGSSGPVAQTVTVP